MEFTSTGAREYSMRVLLWLTYSQNTREWDVAFEWCRMRKWHPPDTPSNEEWRVVHQIVVPPNCRKEILNLAHGSAMAGHLGINKTYHKILTHFYWPGLKKDVVQFCRLCHVCQLVGKSNQLVPAAPLQPIPVCGEPFSHALVDCWPPAEN